MDRRNDRVAVLSSEVRDGEDRLLATAIGSFSIFPKRTLARPRAADIGSAAGCADSDLGTGVSKRRLTIFYVVLFAAGAIAAALSFGAGEDEEAATPIAGGYVFEARNPSASARAST